MNKFVVKLGRKIRNDSVCNHFRFRRFFNFLVAFVRAHIASGLVNDAACSGETFNDVMSFDIYYESACTSVSAREHTYMCVGACVCVCLCARARVYSSI